MPLRRLHEPLVDPQCRDLRCVRSLHHQQRQQPLSRQQRAQPRRRVDWAHDAEPKTVARINALPDELARQHAYKEAALRYIESNPAAFVRAAARKFVRFWNIVPNAAEFHGGLYALISAASFGPVLLLALIAAVRRRRQWRMLAPLYLIVGYFTFVHVVTIASLRYRLPIEPLLIVLAAEPLGALVNTLWPSLSCRIGSADEASIR